MNIISEDDVRAYNILRTILVAYKNFNVLNAIKAAYAYAYQQKIAQKLIIDNKNLVAVTTYHLSIIVLDW